MKWWRAVGTFILKNSWSHHFYVWWKFTICLQVCVLTSMQHSNRISMDCQSEGKMSWWVVYLRNNWLHDEEMDVSSKMWTTCKPSCLFYAGYAGNSIFLGNRVWATENCTFYFPGVFFVQGKFFLVSFVSCVDQRKLGKCQIFSSHQFELSSLAWKNAWYLLA